jgi:hypothetical protein
MLHEQFVAKWERTRRKGRHHFIWLYGVLGWGVSTGVVFTLIMFLASPAKQPKTLAFIAVNATLWLLGGYIWGAVMWTWGEWKYEKTVLLLESAGRRTPRTAPEVKPVSEALQRLDDFRPL